MKLLIGTKNPDKIREIKELLKDLDIEFVLPFSLEDVSEDGKTLEENAIKKAIKYAKASSLLTISEDSGIFIDYLGGAPGVHSSTFKPSLSYPEKNRLIIKMLEGVPFEERKATFKSVIAIASPSSLLKVEEGIVSGFIAEEPKGNNGFGYDPIFFYPEFNKTFGEIKQEEKNKVSHRAQALRKIENFLKGLILNTN